MRTTCSITLTAILLAALGCSDDETTSATAATTTTGGSASGGSGGSGGGFTTTGGTGGTASGGAGSGGQLVGGGDPGELTIDIVDLAGADGKTVIVSVLEDDTKLAGICVELSGDPASASSVAGVVGGDPCAVGDPVELSGGVFTLRAGLYTPGNAGPELCLAQDVLVDGDTTVDLGAFQACQ